jgi:hypothetical protein
MMAESPAQKVDVEKILADFHERIRVDEPTEAVPPREYRAGHFIDMARENAHQGALFID